VEDVALDAKVTVILPVHNRERTLRATVTCILEQLASGTRPLELVIFDDGSTDETFEAACELANCYPQVRVFREQFQRGLGAALEKLRDRLGLRQAIVHDGVGPIDVEELAALLNESDCRTPMANVESAGDTRGSRRFAAVSHLNARLSEAHRKLASFRWLRLEEPAAPRRRGSTQPRLSGGVIDVTPSSGLPATTFAMFAAPQ